MDKGLANPDQTAQLWTTGPGERMNRTLKEATVKRYHYENHDPLRRPRADFDTAYIFARKLEILTGLTPYEFICNAWKNASQRFPLDPHQQMPGPNISASWFPSASDGAL